MEGLLHPSIWDLESTGVNQSRKSSALKTLEWWRREASEDKGKGRGRKVSWERRRRGKERRIKEKWEEGKRRKRKK